jgi:PAS domain S-box-containing protein
VPTSSQIVDITGLLTIIGSIFITLRFIFKRIIQPALEFFSKIPDIEAKLIQVHKEFLPNGGSSLRDIVNKIDLRTRKTEERQKAILNDTSYAVFEADESGDFIYINRAFTDYLSKTQEECLGTNWINSIFHEDRDLVKKEWYDCISQKRDFTMQFRLVSRHNDVYPVHANAQALKSQTSSIIGWFGVIQKFSDIESFNCTFPQQNKPTQHFED